jgi:2,3-dihydroxy-p-cumate/2,3-dihydroxybenzoate 3,4-dioxygenase
MTGALAQSVAYARIPTAALDASARFATEILGLQAVDGPVDEEGFRADIRHRAIVFTRDDGVARQQGVLGVELADDEALTRLARSLAENGFEHRFAGDDDCRRRDVHRALQTRDATGNNIEFVIRPRLDARRFFPSRDTGVAGFHGAGLRSTNIDRDVFFWTRLLGARVSDRVGDITYLAFDERHHRIALYPSNKGGVLNIEIEVDSVDQLMRNARDLRDRQVRIAQGPGRQAASGQVFVHFLGPGDMLFSYVAGMNVLDEPPPRPRQFALTADALCAWGSECQDVPELRASPSDDNRIAKGVTP